MDFDFPRQRHRGHWRGDLERAVHKFGVDFFGVYALGQPQRPLELPIAELLVEIPRFLGPEFRSPLASEGQHLPLHADLHMPRIDSGQRDFRNILLDLFVQLGLDCGQEVELRRPRHFFLASRLHCQHRLKILSNSRPTSSISSNKLSRYGPFFGPPPRSKSVTSVTPRGVIHRATRHSFPVALGEPFLHFLRLSGTVPVNLP
jgi:hypothetical protein